MGALTTHGDSITFVRPEYAALANEFGLLAAEFGHAIGPDLHRDMARLASCLERIDRRIDEAGDDEERRQRWCDVVASLGDVPHATTTKAQHSAFAMPRELAVAVDDLRCLSLEQGVLGRVRRIVRDEASTSEAIRSATTMRAFVRVVEREGRLTAALALAIAGDRCGGAVFRRFFFRLAAPANLVDKLLDARTDHKRGEIAIAPGIRLYTVLVLALLRRSTMLLFTSVKPRLIARLALRYLRPSSHTA